MEKIRLDKPVIVEGRYDKNTLSQVIDAPILTTEGFGIFRKKEKQALFRRLAEKTGVILLFDPDGGGTQIRSFVRGILPPDKITELYVPKIPGKEKRKKHPSAAGTLGVEGMEADLLRDLFRPLAADGQDASRGGITKLDFYENGLSGEKDAAARRARLALYFRLPDDMTANALLAALNLLHSREEFFAAVTALFDGGRD